jgi:hypothetical protein
LFPSLDRKSAIHICAGHFGPFGHSAVPSLASIATGVALVPIQDSRRAREIALFNPGQKQLSPRAASGLATYACPLVPILSRDMRSMAASGRSREIIRLALSMASSSRAGPFSNSSAMNTYRTATFR